MNQPRILMVPALRFFQGDALPIYLFSLKASDIDSISAVSRVSRNDEDELVGYQRPEMRKHISEITTYLNRADCVFPNGIILALSSGVKYTPQTVDTGFLEFPCDDSSLKCWIIDGQQRAAALRNCVQPNLHIPFTAIPGTDVSFLREQFIRINNSKPLPRGLITELLPSVETAINQKMTQKRVASQLCDMLNHHKESPFLNQIKRATSTNLYSVFSDTAVIKTIMNSLYQPQGALYAFWDSSAGTVDTQACLEELMGYWWGVRDVFPDAWLLQPKLSRLTHGVGISAIGKLMDRVLPSFRSGCAKRIQAGQQIERVKPYCNWTDGNWEILDGMPWNALQNTPQHIRLLSDALQRVYLRQESSLR